MVLKQGGRRYFGVGEILIIVLLEFDFKYLRLHYLELMIFFVMLVQDLDDQVQPDGFVEHVFPLD